MVSKEQLKYYASVLKSPGMKDNVRMTIKVSRRNILLLCMIVDKGLTSEENKPLIPDDAKESLASFSEELMKNGEFEEEFISSFRELTAKG